MLASINRVEISRTALRHNFRLCRDKAGRVGIMAMVKADGYGHGMVECARIFAEEGAMAFGVAEPREGAVLRRAGIRQPVFVLVGLASENLAEVFDHDLTPVVVDPYILDELSRIAVLRGRETGLHLKVDAGMGRQGVLPGQVAGVVERIRKLPGLFLEGIMAHFPMADERDSPNTRQVFARFQEMTEALDNKVVQDCTMHIANSGGLFHFNETCLDMVRPGISLYGCYPEGEAQQLKTGDMVLRPVMRFLTRVIQVREIPAGSGLGYGRTFVTDRPSTIAVLPVGYADGYLRKLSNRGEVLIQGRRAPVVGRVSMNLTLVDVTDLENPVRPGDEAVLMGTQGTEEISADEVAAWMETISYEVLCLFGKLNPRSYTD